MTVKAGKCILILGMHRSGTSCLAGSLQQHGVYLGKVFEQNPHNKKGNRENADIMKLNNDLLEANGGSWDQPPLELHWDKEHERSRDTIIEGFLGSGSNYWGFKDPRNLLTFEFWMDGLKNVNVNIVGSYRNPLLAANSLHTRNKMSMDKGLLLWEIYNKKLIELYETDRFPMVSFDVDVEEYQRLIYWVLHTLEITPNQNIDELFFDESLRHGEAADIATSVEISGATKTLYRKLNEIYEGQGI
jgi:hypothetical protein